MKKHHPEIPVRGGNMVDGEAFTFLAKAGADFIEVGVGGSPICISRNQKGIGRGQASAVQDVAATRDAFRARTVRTDLLRWRTRVRLQTDLAQSRNDARLTAAS
ncbi:IMP dehydrogenase [Streptomyces sp. NPDC055109]